MAISSGNSGGKVCSARPAASGIRMEPNGTLCQAASHLDRMVEQAAQPIDNGKAKAETAEPITSAPVSR